MLELSYTLTHTHSEVKATALTRSCCAPHAGHDAVLSLSITESTTEGRAVPSGGPAAFPHRGRRWNQHVLPRAPHLRTGPFPGPDSAQRLEKEGLDGHGAQQLWSRAGGVAVRARPLQGLLVPSACDPLQTLRGHRCKGSDHWLKFPPASLCPELS